jgi:type IV pilus assembly protein PilC
MLLSRRLPLASLIDLCRALRHYLGAGLTLRDVFKQQARKGTPAVRAVAERISAELEEGGDLEEALKREQDAFPPLFVSLATVGEQTGMLPEVCRELERYFTLQQSLKRQFLAQIAWPAIQFVAAIFVIAGLILILGIITEMNPGSQGFDPIGLGTGPGPALGFLVTTFALLAAIAAAYVVAQRVLRQGVVDGLLLRVPALGPCLRALAITRFCLALRLTLESGMSIKKALRLSFAATGNGAFAAAADVAQEAVMEGEELTVALGRTHLFPEEFGHVIAVGEESGRLTEVLEQQGNQYHEESERRLRALTMIAGGGVWLAVAILIIIAIFRIALTYIGMLDPAKYGL